MDGARAALSLLCNRHDTRLRRLGDEVAELTTGQLLYGEYCQIMLVFLSGVPKPQLWVAGFRPTAQPFEPGPRRQAIAPISFA